jgi:energy-coupling factor transport system permease protein
MSFLPVPLEPVRPGLLRTVAPVTRLTVAAAWLAVAFAGVDPRVPAVLLGGAVAALVLLSGLPIRRSVRRLSPLLLAAGGLALLTLLVHPSRTDPDAVVLAVVGPLAITVPAAAAALALALRLALIAVSSLLVFGPSDPTTLADSLVQQWRVPDRFAYGTLAALRIAPQLAGDWAAADANRRLRGLRPRGPMARVRALSARLLGLLVSAVRRGERMALAMDARGFDAGRARSRYRPIRLGPRDVLVLAAGFALAACALAVGSMAA